MADKKKFIWAVDAFSQDPAFQLKVGKAVLKLAKANQAIVEPVCVLSPDQLRVPVHAFSGTRKEYRIEAERILQQWTKKIKSPLLTAATFLVQDEFSVRSSVKVLLGYAKQSGAELVGAGTHAKKKIQRFFVGSFAESLALSADVPIFLLSPNVGLEFKTNKILFATDFSEKSLKAFRRLLPMAKSQGSKIVLFHKVVFEAPPPIYGFDPTPVYKEYFDEDLTTKKQAGKQWEQIAKAQGVKVDLVFMEKPGYPADAIVSAVKKHGCGVLALASESGTVAAVLLGSISRQLLRQAPCPIWILHPA